MFSPTLSSVSIQARAWITQNQPRKALLEMKSYLQGKDQALENTLELLFSREADLKNLGIRGTASFSDLQNSKHQLNADIISFIEQLETNHRNIPAYHWPLRLLLFVLAFLFLGSVMYWAWIGTQKKDVKSNINHASTDTLETEVEKIRQGEPFLFHDGDTLLSDIRHRINAHSTDNTRTASPIVKESPLLNSEPVEIPSKHENPNANNIKIEELGDQEEVTKPSILNGKIVKENGVAVEGAKIVCENCSTSDTPAFSDKDGRFKINYSIKYKKKEYPLKAIELSISHGGVTQYASQHISVTNLKITLQ